MSDKLPLSGVTILAVEQYGAGPFGTMLLADLGAEVIKIENPADGGDMARGVGPHFLPDGSSQFFHSFNRNKRSLTLNLKTEEGRALFHRLVAKADAVLNNLRGDLPASLGLDYASLSGVNSAIVCAHLSAYGREGPRKSWPGYDYLIQAEAGYLSVTGEPDGPPARFGLSVVDMMTGLMTAFALACGVIGARASGKGMDVDTSLFDTGLHNLSYLATWYLNAGVNQGREPRSSHPSLTPSQLYRTKDGWLFVMCNKEKFWPILAEALGHPEWATDPRFRSFAERLKNRSEITDILDGVLSTHTTAEWLDRLQGVVPVAPVNDVAHALENPFVANESRIGGYAGPDGTELLRMLAPPVKAGTAEPPRRAGPALGADTDAILRGLGLDEAEIAELRDKGVV
jgi:crotonobetainyl-CoA:carnitine CoA-transferase CaiB-like acyl-CoA transferase